MIKWLVKIATYDPPKPWHPYDGDPWNEWEGERIKTRNDKLTDTSALYQEAFDILRGLESLSMNTPSSGGYYNNANSHILV